MHVCAAELTGYAFGHVGLCMMMMMMKVQAVKWSVKYTGKGFNDKNKSCRQKKKKNRVTGKLYPQLP